MMGRNSPPLAEFADAEFADIESWIFDLDNTLYPCDSNLFTQIDARMTDFIASLLGLEPPAAKKIQKDFYREHGTTLKGLMTCYQIDPEEFLTHVHDIDYSWLKPDVRLGKALGQLPGRKFVFTNGSRSHARAVCTRLGILDLFDGIFDIADAHYIPKPEPQAYQHFLRHFTINPRQAMMFEDLAQNLATAKQLGLRTVLVASDEGQFLPEQFWCRGGAEAAYIDVRTRDLAHFLELVCASQTENDSP